MLTNDSIYDTIYLKVVITVDLNIYTCGVCKQEFTVNAKYKGIIICNRCGSWSYDGGNTFIYARINFVKISLHNMIS